MTTVFSPSELYCPLSSPVVDENMARKLEAHGRNWLLRHFPRYIEEKPRYLAMGAPGLACFTTPRPIDVPRLAIAADFYAWLFLLDDLVCDEAHPAAASAYLGMLPDLLAVFEHPPEPGQPANPFVAALTDLRERIRACASWRQEARYAAALREYLLSILWEQALRSRSQQPSLDAYRSLRRRSGAMLPAIILTCIASGADPGDDELALPEVATLTSLCVDYTAFSNDLISHAKEFTQEDMPLGLPWVLMKQESIALESAMKRSVRVCDDIVRRFIEVRRNVQPQASTALQRYIDVLAAWMRGHLDWSVHCGRYQVREPMTDAVEV